MKLLGLLLLAVAVAVPAAAQQINLDLPEFRELREKASEETTVTLDGRMLRLAAKFLSGDSDERAARDIVQKLDGIYVRSYEFDKDGDYDPKIVERVRKQLGPEWSKIVDVRSRTRENTEVYTYARGEAIAGLVVISAEPRELTIVNIVGPIDLDRLSDLDGNFGVHVHMGKTKKEGKP
jgi:hypothetical protein